MTGWARRPLNDAKGDLDAGAVRQTPRDAIREMAR